MKQLQTNAVVLSRLNYGESDRIIKLLTRDYGKISVMARGVRKEKSKLAGGIELFSASQVSYIIGRGEVDTLISTRLIHHYEHIAADLDRTMLAYELIKLLDQSSQDSCGQEYYELLLELFIALNDKNLPAGLAEIWFRLKLLRLLGRSPNLTTDKNNHRLASGKGYQFSFDDMAFTVTENGPFNENHIKLLRLCERNKPMALQHVTDINHYIPDLLSLSRTLSKQYIV